MANNSEVLGPPVQVEHLDVTLEPGHGDDPGAEIGGRASSLIGPESDLDQEGAWLGGSEEVGVVQTLDSHWLLVENLLAHGNLRNEETSQCHEAPRISPQEQKGEQKPREP